jgi:aminopeptidase-like protein
MPCWAPERVQDDIGQIARHRVEREAPPEQLVTAIGEVLAERGVGPERAERIGEGGSVARGAEPSIVAVGEHFPRRRSVGRDDRPGGCQRVEDLVRDDAGGFRGSPEDAQTHVARRHERRQLAIRATAQEPDALHSETTGQFVHGRLGGTRADDVDRDGIAGPLEEVGGLHDVLQTVEGDEARVQEDTEAVVAGKRRRVDDLVVGADPHASHLVSRDTQSRAEMLHMGGSVEHDRGGQTTREAVFQPVPHCPRARLVFAVAILRGFEKRDERVEDDGRVVAQGRQTRQCDVGVTRKPNEDHIAPRAEEVAREPSCALQIRAGVGDRDHAGAGPDQGLRHDPVARILRIEVADMGNGHPVQRTRTQLSDQDSRHRCGNRSSHGERPLRDYWQPLNGNNDAVRAEDRPDGSDLGTELHDLCAELFPICRSITGDGVRATLDIVRGYLPLEIHEVPSGTAAFDWTVPPEWNIRDAYVRDESGERLIDFQHSNLHVVGYSGPVHERLSFDELRPRLFTLPDRPQSVPYRTSYYADSWGFCLAHDDLGRFREDGTYEVVIDASLTPGALTYAECLLPGETTEEVLISTHVCHPSLANDNASGVALVTLLGRALGHRSSRYSYRLLFIPGTIGSIVWLARNETHLDRIAHGLVVTGVGDPGPLTYKRSRQGTAVVDRAAAYVLRSGTRPHAVIDFSPYGYDERQFCSPGFNLPVGRIGRTPHGEYPEYHTSADDLDFVDPGQLADALAAVLDLVDVLEGNRCYLNTNPKCEPQLGRRGLYRSIGATIDRDAVEVGLLWVLNLSDGEHDLLAIAERSEISFSAIRQGADALLEHGLLEPLL